MPQYEVGECGSGTASISRDGSYFFTIKTGLGDRTDLIAQQVCDGLNDIGAYCDECGRGDPDRDATLKAELVAAKDVAIVPSEEPVELPVRWNGHDWENCAVDCSAAIKVALELERDRYG